MGTQRNVGGCLVVELSADESLVITPPADGSLANRKITVTLQSKSGRRARLKVEAADDVCVERLGQKRSLIPA